MFSFLSKIAGLNDGVYGNANSWIGVGANALAGVKLGATYTVSVEATLPAQP